MRWTPLRWKVATVERKAAARQLCLSLMNSGEQTGAIKLTAPFTIDERKGRSGSVSATEVAIGQSSSIAHTVTLFEPVVRAFSR
jgi:hypothetical protein